MYPWFSIFDGMFQWRNLKKKEERLSLLSFSSLEPKAPWDLIGWQPPPSSLSVVNTFDLQYLCNLGTKPNLFQQKSAFAGKSMNKHFKQIPSEFRLSWQPKGHVGLPCENACVHLVFARPSWNLKISKTGIRCPISSKTSQIRPNMSESHPLTVEKKGYICSRNSSPKADIEHCDQPDDFIFQSMLLKLIRSCTKSRMSLFIQVGTLDNFLRFVEQCHCCPSISSTLEPLDYWNFMHMCHWPFLALTYFSNKNLWVALTMRYLYRPCMLQRTPSALHV